MRLTTLAGAFRTAPAGCYRATPAEAVKVYGQPPGADYYLGRALAAKGDDAGAIESFQRATLLDNEMQRRAWYELARTYRRLGKAAEAHAAVRNMSRSSRLQTTPVRTQ
jgi:predicted Zn-dependent protease